MVVLLALVASATVVSAQRIPPSAMPVFEYAPLPERIRSVRVGPDRRLWFERWYRHGHTSVDHVKQHIEQVFDRLQPELPGIFPVLFEPTGRIWFAWQPYVPHTTAAAADRMPYSLIAYDGAEWIEFEPYDRRPITGRLRDHPESTFYGSNLFANGVAFFSSPQGVYMWRDSSWHFSQIGHRWDSPTNIGPTLSVDPMTDDVLAYFPTTSEPRLWRWSENVWSSIEHIGVYHDVVPTTHGLWISSGDGLRLADVGLDGLIENLTELLNNNDYWIREQATVELPQVARSRTDLIERALRRTRSPEVRERLRIVVETMQNNRLPKGTFRFGEFTVSDVKRALTDGKGTLFLISNRISKDRSRLEPGALVVPESAPPRFVPLGHRTELFHSGVGTRRPDPVISVDDGFLWHPGSNRGDPPELIDLNSGQVVITAPGSDFVLEAAYGRSAAYFRPHRADRNSAWPLVLHRTDFTVPTPRCTVETVQTGTRSWCVRSDGSLLVQRSDRSIWQFDGAEWLWMNHVPDIGKHRRAIKVGVRNAIVAKSDELYELFDDRDYRSSPTLEQLVVSNTDLVHQLFSQHIGPVRTRSSWEFDLLATPAQGIWVVEKGLGRVFDGTTWHSLMLENSTEVRFIQALIPVDRGERVLICATEGVYIARLGSDGPVLQRLPVLEATGMPAEYMTIDDAGLVTYCRGNGQSFFITSEGVREADLPFGRIREIEPDGTVWFDAGPEGEPRFWSWVRAKRDGRTLQPIRVPGASVTQTAIGSVDGSTYIWTSVGVYTLVEGPNDTLKLANSMMPYGLGSDVSDRQFSERGFFVGHSIYDLHIIPIPPRELRRKHQLQD